MRRCKHCNKPVEKGAWDCPNCGASQSFGRVLIGVVWIGIIIFLMKDYVIEYSNDDSSLASAEPRSVSDGHKALSGDQYAAPDDQRAFELTIHKYCENQLDGAENVIQSEQAMARCVQARCGFLKSIQGDGFNAREIGKPVLEECIWGDEYSFSGWIGTVVSIEKEWMDSYLLTLSSPVNSNIQYGNDTNNSISSHDDVFSELSKLKEGDLVRFSAGLLVSNVAENGFEVWAHEGPVIYLNLNERLTLKPQFVVYFKNLEIVE